jgi:hypothetical protein
VLLDTHESISVDIVLHTLELVLASKKSYTAVPEAALKEAIKAFKLPREGERGIL